MTLTHSEVFEKHLGRAGLASLIGGEWLEGGAGEITVEDPATGRAAFVYGDGGREAAEAALDAAEEGGAAWRRLTASARAEVLWTASRLVREQAEALAELEAVSAGKPIRDTRVEVARVADMLAYYAGFADKLTGDVVPVPTSHLNIVTREPLGTIVQLTPWNAPVFTAGWQIAPALAAGNAVVLKPSELTPASSLALARIVHEAGVPPGASPPRT